MKKKKKQKTYIFLSEKHYKNIKLRIVLWLIGYKVYRDFNLPDDILFLVDEPKSFVLHEPIYKPFDEDEWRIARAFDMFGEAHYSCGDKS